MAGIVTAGGPVVKVTRRVVSTARSDGSMRRQSGQDGMMAAESVGLGFGY